MQPSPTTWPPDYSLDDALTAFTERLAVDPLEDIVDNGVRSSAAGSKSVCGAIDAEGKQLNLLSVFATILAWGRTMERSSRWGRRGAGLTSRALPS